MKVDFIISFILILLMIHTLSLRLAPQIVAQEAALMQHIAKTLQITISAITHTRIIKKSIDARQKQIYINLILEVYIDEEPTTLHYIPSNYPDVHNAPQVIIIGAGPAGYFAALKLISLGFRPIVLERGKAVEARKKDISLIRHSQYINPESNYSFGEGGAGAFSDGKLYTRSKKRGDVEHILQIFHQHGAQEEILYDAHPHIGTDRLPRVIANIRATIIKSGGEVHFEHCMTDLLLSDHEVTGVKTADGKRWIGPVILATGHSARDVYHHLYNIGIALEAKPLAVGVRLEHPATLIDQIQYHSPQGKGLYLPSATYSFVTQVAERGVYSFCMCPGGFVVPAATGPEQVVVNGMSTSNRGSKWSNAGMVVEVYPEDLKTSDCEKFMFRIFQDHNFAATRSYYHESAHPLRMLCFQEALERANWQAGGCTQHAPAQRITDFIAGRISSDLPKTSYSPGIISSPLHTWLPTHVSARLAAAFKEFGAKSHGFLSHEAILIGVESRTSSPVRIPRHRNTLTHIQVTGLYPCGEGAGYAGGIVSAAMDGERCAEAIADRLKK